MSSALGQWMTQAVIGRKCKSNQNLSFATMMFYFCRQYGRREEGWSAHDEIHLPVKSTYLWRLTTQYLTTDFNWFLNWVTLLMMSDNDFLCKSWDVTKNKLTLSIAIHSTVHGWEILYPRLTMKVTDQGDSLNDNLTNTEMKHAKRSSLLDTIQDRSESETAMDHQDKASDKWRLANNEIRYNRFN